MCICRNVSPSAAEAADGVRTPRESSFSEAKSEKRRMLQSARHRKDLAQQLLVSYAVSGLFKAHSPVGEAYALPEDANIVTSDLRISAGCAGQGVSRRIGADKHVTHTWFGGTHDFRSSCIPALLTVEPICAAPEIAEQTLCNSGY